MSEDSEEDPTSRHEFSNASRNPKRSNFTWFSNRIWMGRRHCTPLGIHFSDRNVSPLGYIRIVYRTVVLTC